jgi:hypothetical protein
VAFPRSSRAYLQGIDAMRIVEKVLGKSSIVGIVGVSSQVIRFNHRPFVSVVRGRYGRVVVCIVILGPSDQSYDLVGSGQEHARGMS